MVEIRRARVTDADDVARVHARSWQDAYGGILPPDYLDAGVEAERRAYWADAMARCSYDIVLVLVEEGATIGFAGAKARAEPDYDFSVEHLHVLQGHQGKGHGRALLGQTAALARREGARSICLRVFEQNVPAIRFYERLGGVTDAFGTDRIGGGEAPDRRIGWRDIEALIDRCGVSP